MRKLYLTVFFGTVVLFASLLIGPLLTESALAQSAENPPAGYTDTPFLPGGKWRVHDLNRPHPPIVTPASEPGAPPSDAIVLFNGRDLSKWQTKGRGKEAEKLLAPQWKVVDGAIEVVRGTGHLVTKEKFGDVQLHIEWKPPTGLTATSQARGNSGVLLMELYEIQVLDSYDNITYADGQAGSMYGQYPPLVNAARKPGEWQSYDIYFEAPAFDGEKLVKPAYITVVHNGVLLHHRKPYLGPMRHKVMTKYSPHDAEAPLMLQSHGNPTQFRNIWVRRLNWAPQE